MKNAALFKGALVAPTSATFGICAGNGVGSTNSCFSFEVGYTILIVGGRGGVSRVESGGKR